MKNRIFATPALVICTVLSTAAHATSPVPEIDGGSAAIALGLTLGFVALVREYRGRK